MIRIKTCQFGLLFTGITDCISNVKCVNNNIHVIIYSIDIKTYQVEWSHTRYGEVRAGGVSRTPLHIHGCPELRDRIELATSR